MSESNIRKIARTVLMVALGFVIGFYAADREIKIAGLQSQITELRFQTKTRETTNAVLKSNLANEIAANKALAKAISNGNFSPEVQQKLESIMCRERIKKLQNITDFNLALSGSISKIKDPLQQKELLEKVIQTRKWIDDLRNK